jgi:hypothetical protein
VSQPSLSLTDSGPRLLTAAVAADSDTSHGDPAAKADPSAESALTDLQGRQHHDPSRVTDRPQLEVPTRSGPRSSNVDVTPTSARDSESPLSRGTESP